MYMKRNGLTVLLACLLTLAELGHAHAGVVWWSGQHSVSRLESATGQIRTLAASSRVRAIAPLADGGAWVVHGEALERFDAALHSTRVVDVKQETPDAPTYAAVAGDGGVWIAQGKAIDRFVWSSTTTCREFSCALDVDRAADALIRQNLISGASGNFSPGRRPNGALFAGAGAAPAGDLCAGAPAIAVDLQAPITLSIDARNATDNYTASCGLPGRDVVYTIAPGAPVSVDFVPLAGVRSLSLRQACDRDAAELTGGCATGPLSVDSLASPNFHFECWRDRTCPVGGERATINTAAS